MTSRAAHPAIQGSSPNLGALGGRRSISARPAKPDASPRELAPGGQSIDGWRILRAVAEEYDALQMYRIAAGNRTSHASASVVELTDIAARTKLIEDELGKVLARTYRQMVPKAIRDWQKEQAGIGELQLARLLGHLGHPRIATPFHWVGEGAERTLVADEPFERTVSQLVAYCGRTGGRAKRKGMTADEAMGLGKPRLRMITHLIAEGMIKAGVRQTYEPDDRVVYDHDAPRHQPMGSGLSR